MQPRLPVPEHIGRPDWLNNPNPKFHQLDSKSNASIAQWTDSKDKAEIRAAASIAAAALNHITLHAEIGMTASECDEIIHEFIISQDAYPSGVGFMGFPKSVCISPNNVICHGIPNSRPFQDGDFANFDITCFKDGFFGDTSKMIHFGTVDPRILELSKCCQEAMYGAIKICRPGTTFSEIGRVITEIAGAKGFFVDPNFTGHGIGNFMHMLPQVLHNSEYMVPHEDLVMKPGNLFTIEPIICMHTTANNMRGLPDGFTYVSDHNASVQWEHMILITETGCEIITHREDDTIPRFH